MAGASKLTLPPFVPRWPWIGGDLQTVRNWLVRPKPPLDSWPAERLDFAMDDGTGDTLYGVLQRPAEDRRFPLVLQVHGLTGSGESSYMRVTAWHLLRAGYPVLRLDLRGAGMVMRGKTRQFYHGGRTADLDLVVRGLADALARNGVVLAGYSLGGNLVLKYLAEQGGAAPVMAAASISAPIDIHAAQQRISLPRNRIYHRHLLQEMKLERGAGLDGDIRTILDFDNRLAPLNGFVDALDYYRRCSAAPLLDAICRPTLIIHAADDPWIPIDAYRAIGWPKNPLLLPHLMPSGGHVGFHGRGLTMPWHDAALLEFLKAVR
jgi:predicted alpha/beta-fold hydrolase